MELLEHQLGRPLAEYLSERYIDEGHSLRAIAEELGVDVGSVSRWMARLGIPRRPVGRAAPGGRA